jgi:hypothetical protein
LQLTELLRVQLRDDTRTSFVDALNTLQQLAPRHRVASLLASALVPLDAATSRHSSFSAEQRQRIAQWRVSLANQQQVECRFTLKKKHVLMKFALFVVV